MRPSWPLEKKLVFRCHQDIVNMQPVTVKQDQKNNKGVRGGWFEVKLFC